jgi:UDP-N-acetylmuramoyl-tripeptide--D-alanyl-D-alanine ligase
MSWRMSLSDLEQGTGGNTVALSVNEFTGVSTDGRADNRGKVFFALKGEKFDAHDFVNQAIETGARALVVHKPVSSLHLKFPLEQLTIVEVKDTLKALQELSHFWRKKSTAKIIGITGTNGKTTTKEFAIQLISAKYPTFASKGSFNNHFGVPISLLGLEPLHKVGIFEMGMNHHGELKELVKISDPDIVLVTMVGRGHLEGMGSIEGVAKEKESFYLSAREDAVRIFNLDNPYTKEMMGRAPKKSKILTFSAFEEGATVRFKDGISTLDYIEITGNIAGEPGRARIPVFGRQNISNLMAASCLALASGVEPDLIWKALPKCKTSWGRNQIVQLKSGSRLIFDGYNANPESMAALMENLSRLSVKGKKIVILGEMLEMGSHSAQVHNELGRKAARTGADVIWFCGTHGTDFAQGVRAEGFNKKLIVSDTYEEKLALEVARMLETDDIVLVKGSRGMKLERVVSALDPQDFKNKN